MMELTMNSLQPKILIVDDKSENLFALEQTLKPLNASLTRAMSGEEALSQVLRQQFALILIKAYEIMYHI